MEGLPLRIPRQPPRRPQLQRCHCQSRRQERPPPERWRQRQLSQTGRGLAQETQRPSLFRGLQRPQLLRPLRRRSPYPRLHLPRLRRLEALEAAVPEAAAPEPAAPEPAALEAASAEVALPAEEPAFASPRPLMVLPCRARARLLSRPAKTCHRIRCLRRRPPPRLNRGARIHVPPRRWSDATATAAMASSGATAAAACRPPGMRQARRRCRTATPTSSTTTSSRTRPTRATLFRCGRSRALLRPRAPR